MIRPGNFHLFSYNRALNHQNLRTFLQNSKIVQNQFHLLHHQIVIRRQHNQALFNSIFVFFFFQFRIFVSRTSTFTLRQFNPLCWPVNHWIMKVQPRFTQYQITLRFETTKNFTSAFCPNKNSKVKCQNNVGSGGNTSNSNSAISNTSNINSVKNASKNSSSLFLHVLLGDQESKLRAVVDSGATNNFISEKFAKEHGIQTRYLGRTFTLELASNSPVTYAKSETVELVTRIDDHLDKHLQINQYSTINHFYNMREYPLLSKYKLYNDFN